jgi:CheY-like chemotaxis protein
MAEDAGTPAMATVDEDERACVLLVENDDEFRYVLALVLQYDGYAVRAVATCDDALDLLRGGLVPCVIVLDLVMPHDGWRFRDEQRRHAAWSRIPVIVGTAFSQRVTKMPGELAVDPDHYLLKPFELSRLLDLVARHCGPAQPGAHPPHPAR